MRNGNRGFTLIEVMTVLVILSVLLGVSIPKYQEVRRKAVAARVVGSVLAVRNAAFQFNEANGAWPRATAAGRVPRGLAPFLPSGFNFRTTDGTLAWQMTTVRIGRIRRQVGQVQVRPTDATVCRNVATALGGSRNPDLTIACTSRGGTVALFVDR